MNKIRYIVETKKVEICIEIAKMGYFAEACKTYFNCEDEYNGND